jgi:hypothetical protein
MSKKLMLAVLAGVRASRTSGITVAHNNHPPWKNGK